MKIAVLYAGHIRTWEHCRANQMRNVITPESDLYFYTYTKPENTRYVQYIQVHETFYDKELNMYDANRNPYTCVNNTLQSWHNLFIGFCLVPKVYDIYVKSRCDIELTGKINYAKYDINDTNVYIPIGNDHWGGVNDQFVFGGYQVMKKYFSVYLDHQILFTAGHQFHTEAYVTHNMKRLGVNIVRIPEVTNSIIR